MRYRPQCQFCIFNLSHLVKPINTVVGTPTCVYFDQDNSQVDSLIICESQENSLIVVLDILSVYLTIIHNNVKFIF